MLENSKFVPYRIVKPNIKVNPACTSPMFKLGRDQSQANDELFGFLNPSLLRRVCICMCPRHLTMCRAIVVAHATIGVHSRVRGLTKFLFLNIVE